MKKTLKILSVILFLLSANHMNGQVFSGGVETGFSASQIDGDCRGGYYKLGFNGGIFADMKTGKKSFLRSGIYLIDKGAHSGPKDLYYKIQISEVEVPLWYEYDLSPKLGFAGGLSAAYIYKAYYDAGTYIPKDQLNISNWDYTFFISLRMKIYKNLYFRLSNSYGIVPITRPITFDCWRQSVYLGWLYPSPYCDCWWTNTMRVTLEIKLSKK